MNLPDPAQYVIDAAREIGAKVEDLDNGGWYLFRVSKGGRDWIGGGGALCAYPINTATSYSLSRDKAHTKSALSSHAIKTIPGGLFFAHQRRIRLRGPGREIDDAVRYASQLGFPVFVKPNLGARGNFAEMLSSEDEVRGYARRVAVEYESFLVEPVIHGDEHRVLIHDGRPVFHSVKQMPALIGDGSTTLERLLADLNDSLEGSGVSPSPAAALALSGRHPHDIPALGERVPLPGRRNLSAAGAVDQVSTDVPLALANIAIYACYAIGLRFGAVDLFDVSPAGDLSDLLVIEVNGNPALRTLELAGRRDVIQNIWVSMLLEMLEG